MDWPPGWRDLSESEREQLAAEIERELGPAHILYGRDFRVISRRDDSDDVLIELDDGEIAEMHLTWTKEKSGAFPGAILFVDLHHWREAQV